MALEDGRPRRLHVLSPVFFAARHARRLWPLALLLAARRQWWLLALGALVLLAWSSIEWLRRTYVLEGGALRLEEGVLSRQLRAVPFDRIQQVDLIRKPLHRLLGVATLRVETAGGGSAAEVDLDVVTLAEAQALRSSLLRAKARLTAGPAGQTAVDQPDAQVEVAAPPPERVLLRLPLGEVMLAGITGSRAAAALVVLGPLTQAFDWFPGLSDWFLARFDPQTVAPTTPAAFVVVAVLGVVVWLGLAAASSVVTDYGFTLAEVGSDLVVRRGLLERREAVLPLARLQVVRIEESLLRRALGLASIRIQSAGRAGGSDQTASRLAIPILQRSQVNRVLDELLAGAAPIPALRAPPPAARRRAVTRSLVRTAVFIALVALSLWLLNSVDALDVPASLALATLPLLALAVVAGLAAYRSLGHAASAGFLYARAGVAVRVVAVVPVAKAQSGSVRSSLFQRRAGLATVHVDIAGGGSTPRVHDEAEPRAELLLQILLGRRVPSS
ncbi:MAG TPA: PH domain-containing protein [Actinomycetota bacterium]|nr:PH domain-containing protein [Actinomycetota bacterium]